MIEAETEGPFDPAALVGKEGIRRGAEHRPAHVPGRRPTTRARSRRSSTTSSRPPAGTLTTAREVQLTLRRGVRRAGRARRARARGDGRRRATPPRRPRTTRHEPVHRRSPRSSPGCSRSSAASSSRSAAARARSPRLVFGPFLIMAVFGLGYNGYKKPLPTLLVIPPESGLPTDVADLPGPRRARASRSSTVVPDDDRATTSGSRRARSRSSAIAPGGRAADVRVRAAVRRSRSGSTSPTPSRPPTPR